MTQQSLQPVTVQTLTTDEEFTIQALTIHGAFFERKCQDVVRQTENWTVRDTNYPVEHQGKASNLDLWAEKTAAAARLSLPIECKKNNPEFIDWVFFPQSAHTDSASYVQGISLKAQVGKAGNWAIQPLLLRMQYDLVVCDEARETKGNYLLIKNRQDRTKTSNTAITEAATQIAIAAQSILQQENQILQKLSSAIFNSQSGGMTPYTSFLCFPTIVTTANLYSCEFQEADVDLVTGEIPLDKAKLVKRPYLLFNYALPVALQSSYGITEITYESYWKAARNAARMPIFVVQSKAFPAFLERITVPKGHSNLHSLPGDEIWYTLELHPETVTI
jgi:hypothetical protein